MEEQREQQPGAEKALEGEIAIVFSSKSVYSFQAWCVKMAWQRREYHECVAASRWGEDPDTWHVIRGLCMLPHNILSLLPKAAT